MSELVPSVNIDSNEHEVSAEARVETRRALGADALEQMTETETNDRISSEDTAEMINAYKSENGSVNGLNMKELLEKGFDPDMVLLKLGGERLEEKLDIVNNRYRAQRGTESWKRLEDAEARYLPVSVDELAALIDAGANPQNVVDALQRTKPEDGVDNYASATIVKYMDEFVEAGLSPKVLASRLTPEWRETVKDRLAEAQVKWDEANRLKSVA